jgi:hypothetical protein
VVSISNLLNGHGESSNMKFSLEKGQMVGFAGARSWLPLVTYRSRFLEGELKTQNGDKMPGPEPSVGPGSCPTNPDNAVPVQAQVSGEKTEWKERSVGTVPGGSAPSAPRGVHARRQALSWRGILRTCSGHNLFKRLTLGWHQQS